MPNGMNDKSAPGISPVAAHANYLGSTHTKNIWSSPIYNIHDVPDSRDSNEAPPSAFGSFPAATDAAPWASAHPWNAIDPTATRLTPGDASPSLTRDERGAMSLSSGAGFFSLFDQDTAPTLRQDKKGAQDAGYPGMGIGSSAFVAADRSRDGSAPSSRHSHSSAAQDMLGLGDRPASNGLGSAGGLRRTSIPSFATTNTRAYDFNNNHALESLHDHLDSIGLGSDEVSESPDLMMPGTGPPAASYAGLLGQPRLSRLNPASKPWTGGRNGGTDYAESLGTQERIPPAVVAHSGYPMPSPHSFTPTHGSPAWMAPRPTLREPKGLHHELHRRAWLQSASPNSQIFGDYSPHPPIYSTNFAPHYSLGGFDPYLLGGYRSPVHLGGYSAGPMSPPYFAGAASPRQLQREQDPARGMRSMLLEGFKSHRNHSRYSLRDIYGHVVEFSGDQHGSRFIQSKLETANSDEKEVLFQEISPNAVQLMKDVFGNYVIQKFFAHGNQIQKKVLAGHMQGKMMDLSLQMYSCRVVQKALEHVLVEQQAEMARELEHDVLKVIKDQNGNHVVQKMIELVPRQHIDFIMDAVRGQVSQLASHLYGCRVIQRLLEHGSHGDKRDLLDELHAAAQILIADQYGNYVAQHIIQHGWPEDRARMIRLVTGQLLALSRHKFASNVVEACIQHGSEEERKEILTILIEYGSDTAGHLYAMMKDQYGNYVIQRMYLELRGEERAFFVELLAPFISVAKESGSTRQITALERLIFGTSRVCRSVRKTGLIIAPTGYDDDDTLSVGISSAAPTPSLTNALNTPQSASPQSVSPQSASPQSSSPQNTRPTGVNAGPAEALASGPARALGDAKVPPTGPKVRVQET